METLLVYAKFASPEEAKRTACIVLAENLAACANILARTKSLYYWDGALQETQETPCVMAFCPVDGFEPFLQWVVRQTGSVT